MKPSDNIGYLFQHLASTMARQNDLQLQDQLGIGYSQFKLLMVLEKNPHIQQRDIAEALGQTEASISRQIKLMQADGLIDSRVSPENRRRRIIKLTPKGLRMAESAARLLGDYHSPAFQGMTDNEQAKLMELLNHLHDGVCQAGRDCACQFTGGL